MALLCLDCFNKVEGTNFTYKDVECDMDFCEQCGKNSCCVVGIVNNKEVDED